LASLQPATEATGYHFMGELKESRSSHGIVVNRLSSSGRQPPQHFEGDD
jgi:hypothetical protein